MPSIFFTPGVPQVTFNSNLKVSRAPARNIPQLKPVICPTGSRRGPCRDPPGTRRQFLKESTQGTRPGSLRNPGGSLCGPDLACRGPERCSAGAFTMPRYPCIISYQKTNLSMFNVQSINPSINQSNNVGYFSIYKLCCNLNQLASQNVYKKPSL